MANTRNQRSGALDVAPDQRERSTRGPALDRPSLSVKDSVLQAQAFLSFTRRGGDAGLWWRSKDFQPHDRRRIRTAIRRLGGGA